MRIVSDEKVRGRKTVIIEDVLVSTEDTELKKLAMEHHHETHDSLFDTRVKRTGSRARVDLYTD